LQKKGSIITPAVKKKWLNKLLANVLVLLLLAGLFNLLAPTAALADPSDSVEITGDGVMAPVTLTMAQLQGMQQYEHIYSTINTFPTKKWYVASGVKLRDLLDLAGIKPDARLIRFNSNDGYEVTLTVKELLKDKRYYFPHLKDNDPSDGSIPGSPKGAQEVEPILALLSAEGKDNPADMNDRDSLLLVIGQRAVTEQTNNLFLKYVTKIEVLTTPPPKWDNPKADIPSGEVPAGTKVKLSNRKNDMDKIYYTTDGSTPTINSPMYNWIASRWKSQRGDVDLINHPIEIKKDTVIKAVTIGPGREDSDIVTFTYKADFTGKVIDLTRGLPAGITLDQHTVSLKIGSSEELLVANTTDQDLTYSSSDTRVVTVDSNGLVTRVGHGTATITVKTADGKYTATCIVREPEQVGKQAAAPAGAAPQNNGEPMNNGEPINPAGIPAPEAGQPSPAEKDEAAGVDSKTLDQAPDNPAQLPVPEGKGQYLVEKEAVTATSTAAGVPLGQQGGQTWRVFELTPDALPLPLQEEQDRMDTYTALIFMILLLLGAIRRYTEYAREVAR